MLAPSPELESWVGGAVLSRLGLEGRPFRLEPPAPGGTTARTFRLAVDGEKPMLLRLFEDPVRARRAAAALRHLETLGLEAPRLRAVLAGFRPSGRSAVVETWIDGVRALDVPDPDGAALQVAGLLARWHAVLRPRWGRPSGFPELRPYAALLLRRVRGMISSLERRGALTAAEAAAAGPRFEAWRRPLRSIGEFSLVHNDVNRRNLLRVPSGELVPIDVQRISYEPCAEEVANAVYHFCRHDPALAARFVAAWREAAAPPCRALWDAQSAFFSALNALKRLHRRTGAPAGPEAPGAAPATVSGDDPRLPEWKAAVLGLPPPPS